ncbi:MAG: ABC transporter permease [Bacteroidota bacterium]
MFDLDKWQEIFASLSRNKLRTFLTAIGVSWGIFMLVIMMAAGNGLESGAKQEFKGRATNSVSMWTQRTTMPYRGLNEGRWFSMTNEDYYALEDLLPEANLISPRNQLGGYKGGNNVKRGLESGAFQVNGDYPQIQHIEGIQIEMGRFLNMRDIDERRKVAIIGLRVQELLFDEDESPLGEYIDINDISFQVVGVFSTKSSGERAENETQRIHVPFSTFQRAFNYGNRVGWFSFTSQDHIPASIVEEKAKQILKARHKVHPKDPRAFGSWNTEEGFKEMNQVFFGIDFISWVVAILTLFAGAIGISNIMLVIIKERTKEIGVRRAIGAKPYQIVSQIMLESVFLTFIAGYCGLMGGIGLVELIAWIMNNFNVDSGIFMPPYVDVKLSVISLGTLILAGLLAGLIPSSRAIRIRPVEALRAD